MSSRGAAAFYIYILAPLPLARERSLDSIPNCDDDSDTGTLGISGDVGTTDYQQATITGE